MIVTISQALPKVSDEGELWFYFSCHLFKKLLVYNRSCKLQIGNKQKCVFLGAKY